jgi:hypothetical protein
MACRPEPLCPGVQAPGRVESRHSGKRSPNFGSPLTEAFATDIFCQGRLISGAVAYGESLEPFRPPYRSAARITVSASCSDRRCARAGTTSLGTHDLSRPVRVGRTGRAGPRRSRRWLHITSFSCPRSCSRTPRCNVWPTSYRHVRFPLAQHQRSADRWSLPNDVPRLQNGRDRSIDR